jgi:hypothetical protein
MRSELEPGRISVQLDLNGRVPMISGDRGQLQQVVLKLVSSFANAMRPVTNRATSA